MKTIVESMEFRGSVYRTEVRVIDEETHLYNEKIVVDILASEVEKQLLGKESRFKSLSQKIICCHMERRLLYRWRC